MPSICTINLNKEGDKAYFAGECVSGTIVLQTFKVKKISCIRVALYGLGKVRFPREIKPDNTFALPFHLGSITYVKKFLDLQMEGTLNVDTYSFPFSFMLPTYCETSIESKFGHVRYQVQLEINNQDKYDNIFIRPITVIRNLNLNEHTQLHNPQSITTSSNLWCSNDGELVTFTLKTPYSAYVPGQTIKCEVQIQNKPPTLFNGYMLTLIRKITFTVKEKKIVQTNVTTELVSKFLEEEKNVRNQTTFKSIQVPATPPSTLNPDIIFVEYLLTLRAAGTSSNGKINYELPIIIGTVPMKESLVLEGAELPSAANTMVPTEFQPDCRSEPTIVETEVDERNRVASFKPLYPFFDPSYFKPSEE